MLELLSQLEINPDDNAALARVIALRGDDAWDEPGVLACRDRLIARGRFEAAGALWEAALETDDAGGWVQLAAFGWRDLFAPERARAWLDRAMEEGISRSAALLSEELAAAESSAEFAAKYETEAERASDRELAASLYVATAECLSRTVSTETVSVRIEVLLGKALDLLPSLSRASILLERRLRAQGRWLDLALRLRERATHAKTTPDRIAAWTEIAAVSIEGLGDVQAARDAIGHVLALDPTQSAARARQALLQVTVRRRGGASVTDNTRKPVVAPDAALTASMPPIASSKPERAAPHEKRTTVTTPVRAPAVRAPSRSGSGRDNSRSGADAPTSPAARIAELLAQRERAPANRQLALDLVALLRGERRWTDLTAVLAAGAEQTAWTDAERLESLRVLADVWGEKINNLSAAVTTWERVLALAPNDAEAIAKLKDLYSRRKQWRALIALLGREAESMAGPARVDKRVEMGRLALERVGDSRWASELWNEALAEATGPAALDVEAQLVTLYERDKRWRCVSELLWRAATRTEGQAALPFWDRLGTVASERLDDVALARTAFTHVIALDPRHAKAVRFLRHDAARLGDVDAIAAAFPGAHQVAERVDALLLAADGASSTGERVRLFEAAEVAGRGDNTVRDRMPKIWEALLALVPGHPQAAAGLMPQLRAEGQWPRLVALYEAQLPHKQGALAADWIREAAQLCERELNARRLTWDWLMRGLALRPVQRDFVLDAIRLAETQDFAQTLAATAAAARDSRDVELLQAVAQFATERVRDDEAATALWDDVLDVDEQSERAKAALEHLAQQRGDVAGLITLRRARVARRSPATQVSEFLQLARLAHERSLPGEVVDELLAEAERNETGKRGAAELRLLRAEKKGDQKAQLRSLQALAELDLSPEAPFAHRGAALAAQAGDAALAAQFASRAWVSADADARDRLAPLLQAGLDSNWQGELATALFAHAQSRQQWPTALSLLSQLAEHGDANALRTQFDIAAGPARERELAWRVGEALLSSEADDDEMRGAMRALADRTGQAPAWLALLVRLGSKARTAGLLSLAQSYERESAPLALRLGQPELAETQWRQLVADEPADRDAFANLAALLDRAQRSAELSELEWKLLPHWPQDEQVKALRRLVARAETKLDNVVERERAYRELVRHESAAQGEAEAYWELLHARGAFAEARALLVDTLQTKPTARWAQLALIDEHLRAGEPHEALVLLEELCKDTPVRGDAIARLRQAANAPPIRADVLRILVPILTVQKRWSELIELTRDAATVAPLADAVDQWGTLAELEEKHGDLNAAFAARVRAYEADPDSDHARTHLFAAAQRSNRWDEVAAAIRAAANKAEFVPARIERLTLLASVLGTNVGSREGAADVYREMYELDADNPNTVRLAGQALAAHYERTGQWPQLLAVTERMAQWADGESLRLTHLRRAATIALDHIGDSDKALQLRRTIADDSGAADDWLLVEQLLEQLGRHSELVTLLRERSSTAPDRATLRRIAELELHDLRRPVEAAQVYRDMLGLDPHDAEALAMLVALLRHAGADEHGPELIGLLETQVQRGYIDATTGRRERAQLLERTGSTWEAFAAWSDLLDSSVDAEAHAYMRRALERSETARRAYETLAEYYQKAGRLPELVSLLETAAPDDEDSIGVTQKAAVLREQLGQPDRSLDLLLARLPSAVDDDRLSALLADVDRLSAQLGRERDLIDAYRAVAPNVTDGELQRRLYFDVADLARGIRHDNALARTYYELVLEQAPDNPRALAAVESIARQTGDRGAILAMLERRVELVSDAEAVEVWAEIADVSQQLGRVDGARQAWERICELTTSQDANPARLAAQQALAPVYAAEGRWRDVLELLEARANRTVDTTAAVALRMEMAEVLAARLGDAAGAAEMYADVLRATPQHPAAREALERMLAESAGPAADTAARALEPYYVARQDWDALGRIYELRLASTDDTVERRRLLQFMARLTDEQLEDFDASLMWTARLFREEPSNRTVRDQYQRLAHVTERFGDMVKTYTSWLADGGGDPDTTRAVAIVAAQVADKKLRDVATARTCYAAAWRAAPDDYAVFSARAEFLHIHGPVEDLRELYDDALSAGWTGERYRTLLVERAMFLQEVDGAAALAAWRDVLDDNRDAQVRSLAWSGVEVLLERAEDWYGLVDALEARLGELARSGLSRESEREQLLLRKAQIQDEKIGDPAGAAAAFLANIDVNNSALSPDALTLLERWSSRREVALEPLRALEARYRGTQEWSHLVAVLERRAQFAEEPEERTAVLREISVIAAQRLGDSARALASVRSAWLENVDDPDVLDELLEAHKRARATEPLIACLLEGLTRAHAESLRATIASHAAKTAAGHGDNTRALDLWQLALDAAPEDPIALAELDGLLAHAKQWPRWVDIVRRRIAITNDAALRRVLTHRLAAALETEMADIHAAAQAWHDALELTTPDLEALDALERIYTQLGVADRLLDVYEMKLAASDAPAPGGALANRQAVERRRLRFAMADVRERQQNDVYGAIEVLVTQRLEAVDDETLARLASLYAKAAQPVEQADALMMRAALTRTPSGKAGHAVEAADVLIAASEPDRALEALRCAIEAEPRHEGARRGLMQLAVMASVGDEATTVLDKALAAANDAAAQAALYEHRLDQADLGAGARCDTLRTLANTREHRLRDTAGAWSAAARLCALEPSPPNRQLLRRLTEVRGAWVEYMGTLESLLRSSDVALEPAVEAAVASELGQLTEQHSKAYGAAAAWYERAANTGVGEVAALEHSVRLHSAARAPAATHEPLRRLAELVSGDRRVEYLAQLATAQEATGATEPARRTWEVVLEASPRHAGARAALFRALSDPTSIAEVAPLLEALCEREANWSRLADVLDAERAAGLGSSDDLLRRLAELVEQRLHDAPRALGYALDRFAQEPTPKLLAEVMRLGQKTGNWTLIDERLAQVATHTAKVDPWLAVARGRLALNQMRDAARAAQLFEAALSQGPDADLLDGAIEARLALGASADAARWLTQKADLLGNDDAGVEARLQAADQFMRASRVDDAISQWLVVTRERPEHPRAAHAWEQVTNAAARHAPVAQQAQYLQSWADASAGDAARPLLRRRAVLLEASDPKAGLAAWRELAESHAPEARDVDAFERAATAVGDMPALARALDLRLAHDDEPAIRRRLAETLEAMGDSAGALAQWRTLAARGDRAADEAALAMLGRGGRWQEMIDELEDRRIRRPSNHAIATVRIAEIWSEKLGNVDSAIRTLEAAAQATPEAIALLVALSRAYERAGRASDSQNVLTAALAQNARGVDLATLCTRLAEMAIGKESDNVTARNHLRSALEASSTFEPALRLKAQIARTDRNSADLRSALTSLIPVVPEGARGPLWRELGLLERKEGRAAEGARALTSAYAVDGNDREVVDALLDAHLVLGESDAVLRLVATPLAAAESAKHAKDLVRYRGIKARALELAGDLDGALALYDQALRSAPTDPRSLVGVGRIAVARSDWDRARRVYRALVLQDLSPELGTTRADAYLQLGQLHLRDGEPDKARQMWKRGLEMSPKHPGLTAALAAIA